MRLSCIHCGRQFSITANQLGGRGRCPHCLGEIQLPKAADQYEEEPADHYKPRNWLENSISGLASMVIHMLLIIVASVITWGYYGGVGAGEDVLIGSLPDVALNNPAQEQLQADARVEPQRDTPALEDPLEEIQPPMAESVEEPALEALIATPSPTAGGSASFDLGAVSIGGASGGGGSWEGMIKQLRRNGLDIVITFDSTGSMSGEINEVKRQIGRIGQALVRLVPKTRIGICTYRDEGDEYVVKGLPLTNDIQQVQLFLDEIYASGGGDHPEAVHEGLRWPMVNNQFRSRARKVILLFGDAPPHQKHKKTCLQLAADFNSQQGGIVSTVTCRSNVRLPEFIEIAQMGGGEAFLTSDERQIMTQLMVLVFGSRYRSKVLDAFKTLGR